MVRCGAGAGLNIEICGAVRAPALDDGAVRVRASSLRGGAVAGQTFRPAQGSTRNVSVESGQSCYTEEVQSQGAGLTRPVFVTVMEYSSPVLKEGAMIAPGISTEMIPTTLSVGRRNPVDQLGLVGPQDKTEQSVLPGSDTKEVGTDPAGPDVTVDQIQPVAEGPVGQYITRRPVAQDGMFSTCDSDQPMADGPVGQFITRSPVDSDGMFSTCDSDQPMAEVPVHQSFILGPVGPRRMLSQCKPSQPVAVGPVGQSFTPGPVRW